MRYYAVAVYLEDQAPGWLRNTHGIVMRAKEAEAHHADDLDAQYHAMATRLAALEAAGAAWVEADAEYEAFMASRPEPEGLDACVDWLKQQFSRVDPRIEPMNALYALFAPGNASTTPEIPRRMPQDEQTQASGRICTSEASDALRSQRSASADSETPGDPT